MNRNQSVWTLFQVTRIKQALAEEGLSDINGVIRQHLVFDSFGNRLSETDYNTSGAVIPSTDPAAVDELFGYTGREWDSDVKLQYNRARWYDPAQGRWLSQDPIGFAAGDVNLYRYVGNDTTGATDPSGLADFGLPPWKEMPSYDPDAGMRDFDAGNNSGNPTFRRWIIEDPPRASAFIQGIYSRYRRHVTAASHLYDVPAFLIYGTIIPEMINFSWADYHDFGSSRGPGQLTIAIIDFYNVQAEADALCREKQQGLKSPLSHWADTQGMRGILYKAAILDRQLQELELAARGGGTLEIGDGEVITIPAMSDEFKKWAGGIRDPNALSKTLRRRNPAIVKDFFGNGIPALVAVLIAMNRNNPGATGNADGLHQYAGTQGFRGPQAQIGFSLFRDGYFRCSSTGGKFEWGNDE